MSDQAVESPPVAPEPQKPKKAEPVRPPSEDEIDSPDRTTLILLFVIFVVTVSSWGAARFACNMHPPQSRPAPKLTTNQLIGTAKDGAIEFVQRWRSADYSGALEIAAGDLVAEMQKLQNDCQARANECAREREAAAGRLTTAVVLNMNSFKADARVTTTLKGVTETYRVVMAREGALWKAGSKTKE
jgi:hypothetical protein